MILSLKRPENRLICILLSVPSQKRPGGIGILFFWHFFCIKLKLTMKVFYFLNGILISFLVLIMSASTDRPPNRPTKRLTRDDFLTRNKYTMRFLDSDYYESYYLDTDLQSCIPRVHQRIEDDEVQFEKLAVQH